MDRVGRGAEAIRAGRAALDAEAADRRRQTAQQEADFKAAERARQQRMQQILAMTDRERRWLLFPGDRRILAEVREMEWYSEAGERLDVWVDAFRKWATENDIPTNVNVAMPPHHPSPFRRDPAPEPMTSGWVIFSDTHTWREDTTPAWDRFPRSEERSATTHFFIPKEMQSQPSYYGTKDLANVRATPFGPDRDNMYAAHNPQRMLLPQVPNDAAIGALERRLTNGMSQWVVDNPKAPWSNIA